jgi:hypothetical protein
MLRTYKAFPGWQRMMSELQFIPSNQRFEFLSQMVANSRLLNNNQRLSMELDEHVKQVNQLRSELLDLGDKYYELRRSIKGRIVMKINGLRSRLFRNSKEK